MGKQEDTSNKYQQLPNEQGSGKSWSPVLIAIVLLVTIAAVFYYFFVAIENYESDVGESSDLSGKIHLSLLSKDPSKQELSGIPQASTYNLELGTFERAIDGQLFSYQYNISPNGVFAAFLGESADTAQDVSDFYSVNTHVYRGRLGAGGDSVIEVSDLSATEGFAKYTPAVSNTGEVLFTLLKEKSDAATDPRFADFTVAGLWDIFFIDSSGEQVKLTTGIYPHWATETQFVFLKDDGLYYYDLNKREEHQLLSAGEDSFVATNSMVDVSDSGNLIVWSTAESGLLYLLETRNWYQEDGPEIYTRNVFNNLFGFWPVLSPDGKYFALEVVDPTHENILTDPKPHLVFYDTSTFEKVPFEVDLDEYDQLEMYVTDWK